MLSPLLRPVRNLPAFTEWKRKGSSIFKRFPCKQNWCILCSAIDFLSLLELVFLIQKIFLRGEERKGACNKKKK
jgi:hypothetical protein